VHAEALSLEKLLQEAIPQEHYPEVIEPLDPVLKHDLSHAGPSTYVHWQKDVTIRNGSPVHTTLLKGQLVLEKLGDGTASLSGKNAEAMLRNEGPKGASVRPQTIKVPDLSLKGLKEDGSWESDQLRRGLIFDVVFPLPSKLLGVGETAKSQSRYQIDVSGVGIWVTSEKDITLTRYVQIGKRVCAQLDVAIKIFSDDTPDVKESERSRLSAQGVGLYYFDVSARKFIFSAIALDNEFKVKSQFGPLSAKSQSLIRVNLTSRSQSEQL
jgi:hypothetical protein